ncbi:helix-turn-helix protein [Pseudovibrio axinellae]|uniref:Helix-turn-helix protein n=1 Tax=Pseudovibrio axinellae TaxID=989403 RepID=A0A165XF31_9HYPH|nr:helix-turn-helix transcriptional regulator [Pseudovibrio axinellae]KZL17646.1 helix-turn-helix protein [Pseudovibrio axinellae]SER45096.1 Helix-turn-helix [Pseudovibrio axinellae]
MRNTSIGSETPSTTGQPKLAFKPIYFDKKQNARVKNSAFGAKSQNIPNKLMYNASMTRGERIIQKRKELSWSRVKLADVSCVGYDRLNKLERDMTKEPRGDTLNKIARSLGVSVHYLETGEERDPNLDSEELHYAIQGNLDGGNGVLAKKAWEAAEAIEERVYGKQRGGMDFLLETYERILKRLINDKDETK